jgi:glycosyltransferase involved in cell wall biosynthesis
MSPAEALTVDCSGAGAGGITRMLTELVRHWPAGERLHLVAVPVGWTVPDDTRTEVRVVSRQSASRARTIEAAARMLGCASGRVLSLSPSLSVAGARGAVTTIVHDLAFRLWPHGLTAAQRRYRHLSYATALRQSARLLCVSDRTRHDLLGLYGREAGRWEPGSDLAPPGRLPSELSAEPGEYLAVAGHAKHKGVELATEAIRSYPQYRLAVLTGGQTKPEPGDRIVALGHLSDPEYAATLARATALLMPSHFEGYGLPAAEAMRLGTPVIISPDPALHEATGGAAIRMTTWTAGALVDAIARIGETTPVAPPPRAWRAAAEDLAARVAS